MKQKIARQLLLLWICCVVMVNDSLKASDDNSDAVRFPDDRNSEVMVLGTYHFVNTTPHAINVEPDDILVQKRQREVEAVVEALKQFSPTMIALEFPSERDTMLNSFYSQYVDGSWDSSESEILQILERSEIVQIGFRLAKELSLKRVYAVDEMTVRPLERMEEFAEENGYSEFLAYRERQHRKMEAKGEEDFRSKTVGQLILEFSSPTYDAESKRGYIEDIRFGNEEEQPGVDVYMEWYRRNVLIFQNLYNITKGKVGERILMIFGADHGHQLRPLVAGSPDFKLIHVSQFLSGFDD